MAAIKPMQRTFRDNVQVTPSLTVNLGLRWDVWTPFHETLDRQMPFFNPTLPNPVAGGILGGSPVRRSRAGQSCGCGTPVLLHWCMSSGRALGFPTKVNNTTVIRAAYDIFYAQRWWRWRPYQRAPGSQPNRVQQPRQPLNPVVSGQPAYYWDSGVPGKSDQPAVLQPELRNWFHRRHSAGRRSHRRRAYHGANPNQWRPQQGRTSASISGLLLQYSTCLGAQHDLERCL